MQALNKMATKAPASSRPMAAARVSAQAGVKPLLHSLVQAPAVQAPALAPVVKARTALETRRALNSIVAQATASGDRTDKPLPIVFVSAECAPWSKTGGLGDVVGGLPIELVKRGHKVITIAPRYDQYSDAWDTSVVLNIDGENVRFFHSIKKGVHRVWVDHPSFLAKVWGKTGSKLYGPKSGADYVDNHKRFTLFCKAAIEATRALPFGFGEDAVFVANDWHSALVPVLLKDVYQPKGQFKKSKVALCIHNIAFQGRMWEDTYKDMNLPGSALDKFSFTDSQPKVYNEKAPLKEDEKVVFQGRHKKLNWLKAGILSADKLVTVSPNYATEIAADASGGVELDTYVRQRGGAVGIVNGMDVEEWDPRVDKYLPVKYNKTNVSAGKAAAKESLQADVGLPVEASAPLFAFIGRLEEQKGVDILLQAVPKILAKAPNAQIVILGTGKAKMEKQVQELDRSFKGRVKGVVKFSAPLAHLITAGADFILVPSRYEPCGLIQLHAMQYGTVPVVSSTGGLVDTVKEGVTGFHMGAFNKDSLDSADADAIAATCARAASAFSTPLFREMVFNCISQDLSWSKPAQKWEGVLEQLYLGVSTGKAESVRVPVAERIPYPVAATDRPLTRSAPSGSPAPSMSNGSSPVPRTSAPALGPIAPPTKAPSTGAPTVPPAFVPRTPITTSPSVQRPASPSGYVPSTPAKVTVSANSK